jgi:hypothetical protein
VKERIAIEGLDILPYVEDTLLPLAVWRPKDIEFEDSIESTVLSTAFKLRPNKYLYWSRHFLLTVSQPGFDYYDYPTDSQDIRIRFQSFGLSASFVTFKFANPAVTYTVSQDLINFEQNPVWGHIKNEYSTKIENVNSPTVVNGVKIDRLWSHGIIDIKISRKSDGVLLRLGVPILILLMLGGLLFWASQEIRIESTMTLLLSVSALYIVIFGNIPLLGYMTQFDKFVLGMFVLLTLCTFLHNLSWRLQSKSVKYPMRQFLLRLIEFIGRISVIPIAIITFLVYFMQSDFVHSTIIPLLICFSAGITFTISRDFGGLKKSFFECADEVQLKMSINEQDDLSNFEIFVYTVYTKYFASRSMRNEEIIRGSSVGVELNDALPKVQSQLSFKNLKANASVRKLEVEDFTARSSNDEHSITMNPVSFNEKVQN